MTAPLLIEGGGISAPHWALFPEPVWPLFENFETFLERVWQHLRLPPPTRAQRRIARRLQEAHAKGEARDIIRAYRGIGKSYITATFVLWVLMRNPRDEKVLVVSATKSKSAEFVAMVKALLGTMDELEFLRPTDDQRNQADRFDVRGASISQSYSVRAASITGQITGGRATLIIPDDIEIPRNSMTEESRQGLFDLTKEFGAIILPGGTIIYLGTPQTEESIYNRLIKERGYACFCIPSRWPTADKRSGYIMKRDDGSTVDILADFLVELNEAGELREWQPTDPERFGDAELLVKESEGRAYYALQYQLDTSLSDAERYPLRTADLVVFECNLLKAPRTLSWGHDTSRKNTIDDIPNLGFSGDQLLRPLFLDSEWRDYEGSVLFVDPSGRGKDETAWAVVKVLNGIMYLLHIGGLAGDPAAAMLAIAKDARRFGVNVVEVEPNFGQGMWVTAFGPILAKVWPGGCTVQESEWAKGQKETRIIDTLEPVMSSHRLAVSESVLRADARAQDRDFSFLFQLTHITRERGALKHDDRLDAVAGAVAHFMRSMAQDVDQAARAQEEAERDADIEDFLEYFESGEMIMHRGARRADGRRDQVELWSEDDGVTVFAGSDGR